MLVEIVHWWPTPTGVGRVEEEEEGGRPTSTTN
jgi:hypothetical protein